MVENQLIARGIKDKRVLAAFLKIPRHEFVSPELAHSAYDDCPLPIGGGQTISQPYMVALMTQLLHLSGREKVLEIGTGSGYQSAVLAELCKEVYSVERIEKLARETDELLKKSGYQNVRIKAGDGSLGWEEYQPYDAIIVTAGAPKVPLSLINQLKDSGRLVIPVGSSFSQILTVVEKKGADTITEQICGCVFVPLLGKEGWKDRDA